MSSGSEGSSRVRTIDVIVALVTVSFVAFLFVDIPTEAKLVIIIVFGVLGFLNFVAYVGLLDRWKRRWGNYKSARSIRRHPDLVTELYRLHDRIKSVLYDRVANKPSLALNVADMMKGIPTSAPKQGSEFSEREFFEKFEMIQRHFKWITMRINDHRTGGRRWTSPEFANILREIGDHLLMVDGVLQTVYRDFPKDEKGHFRFADLALWEAFREEYATVTHEWQSFTERFDETIGYGTKTTIPPPRRLV